MADRQHYVTHPILGTKTWREISDAAYALRDTGRRLCTWCHGDIPKGKQTRCGALACTQAMLFAQDPGHGRSEAFRLAEGKCEICKEPAVEVDHIIPVCLGGTGDQENLRALCKSCHLEETNRLRKEKDRFIAGWTERPGKRCNPWPREESPVKVVEIPRLCRVIISGSRPPLELRGHESRELLRQWYCRHLPVICEAIYDSGFKVEEVVNGCADGGDGFGEMYADAYDIPMKKFPANWSVLGRKAGIVRNVQMADYGDALITFWDGKSKGTAHMISEMERRGKPIHICRLDQVHVPDYTESLVTA